MFAIQDNVMKLTKGDDAMLTVTLEIGESQYVLQPGDKLTFTVRDSTGEDSTLIMQSESTTNNLLIQHTDTEKIDVGQYSADIQLSKANGKIYTVWPTEQMLTDRQLVNDTNWKNFWITPEVTVHTDGV